MSFSAGVFSINSAGQPVVSGSVISSTAFNALTADLATGLSTAILKDGTQTLTANIPMSNFKLTGLAAGAAAGESVRYQQLGSASQPFTSLTSVAGTNTITGTATPTPTYAVGQRYTFIPANTNTGATTLNISSVGAGAVQWAGAALTGGELVAGTAVSVLVTAATPVFEIIGATQFPDTRALVVGGTDATKKLRIGVDGISTATTRVLTMPDNDVSLASATTTTVGLIELAIQSEVDAGTDSSRAITSNLNRIALGTEQASTSGVAIDFTGIPAGTRRITIMGSGVSTNGTSGLMVQIGDAGGPELTVYTGGTSQTGTPTAFTTGFGIMEVMTAANAYDFKMVIDLENAAAFRWISNSSCIDTAATQTMRLGCGAKALSAELTQVRITMVNGTDAFDAGVINISYER